MNATDDARTSLAEHEAHVLVRRFGAGETTPSEALATALAIIGAHDDSVHAMVLTDPGSAQRAAAAADERWAAGRPAGPLDGVPMTIKDMLLTRGWPTRKGSTLIGANGPWEEDAPAVARLRDAGAVFLGKNTTPEFAWKGVTDSLLEGSTGNPWGAGLTSGGSSGGAATAVGLGMGSVSVGTDGGGSVRIPASFTGTVALKPTFGLIPIYPPSAYGTLSHAGPMTRSVTDAALLMDVITGGDPRDWFAMPTPSGSYLDGLDEGIEGLRVAFSPTLGGLGENDPEVEAAVRAAVDVLAGLGARVEEVDPELPDGTDAFHLLWFTGASKVLEGFGPGALDRVDPLLAENVRRHAETSASSYLDATTMRMDMGVVMGRFHEMYDVLVTPTMPIAAFPRGQNSPDGWPSPLWTSWTPYTYPFNMTMQPALTVPCGFTSDERPVGLQIVGPRHADRLVLRAGRAYEAATPWHEAVPTLLR